MGLPIQQVSLTGDDTIIINGKPIFGFADGDNAVLTFPNELMNVKTGKGGNSIYAFNNSGRQCDLVLRVMRCSPDDIFLNALLGIMKFDPPSFILIFATIVKRVGTGFGPSFTDTYILSGGVFTKNVEVKENADGDTEQALSIYNLKFTNSHRAVL